MIRAHSRRDDRRRSDVRGAFEPVIRSAVGVVLESAGLIRNVAGLGFALVCETRKAAPRPPIARAANVIAFPTNPRRKQSK